jgi:hypothetical protein
MAANQRLRYVRKAGWGCLSHAWNMAPRAASVQRDVARLATMPTASASL